MLNIRRASKNDIPRVVQLLASDELGVQRELYQDPLPQEYYDAFTEINADKNNFLMIVEEGGKIIATLQLTIITYLTYRGGKRAQIEGVRIDSGYRGKGIGKYMIEWAINKAR